MSNTPATEAPPGRLKEPFIEDDDSNWPLRWIRVLGMRAAMAILVLGGLGPFTPFPVRVVLCFMIIGMWGLLVSTGLFVVYSFVCLGVSLDKVGTSAIRITGGLIFPWAGEMI